MKMGTKDIVIDEISEVDGYIYISGRNFTPWSAVRVNDEDCDTQYINEYMLRIKAVDLQPGSYFEIAQISDEMIELSVSEKYFYEGQSGTTYIDRNTDYN